MKQYQVTIKDTLGYEDILYVESETRSGATSLAKSCYSEDYDGTIKCMKIKDITYD